MTHSARPSPLTSRLRIAAVSVRARSSVLRKAWVDQAVPAVEIRLERPGPASHKPRTVRELSSQKKRDSPLADQVVDVHNSRFLQREERLTGRPRVTFQPGQLRPAAVGALRTHDAPGHTPLFGLVRAAPAQS